MQVLPVFNGKVPALEAGTLPLKGYRERGLLLLIHHGRQGRGGQSGPRFALKATKEYALYLQSISIRRMQKERNSARVSAVSSAVGMA